MKNTQTQTSNTSTIYPYMLLFFISSVLGWFWEILVRWFAHGFTDSLSSLLNCRGVLHGTWAPIYGFGVLALAIIWNIFKGKKIPVILTSILACGVLEYVSGYLLEKLFHRTWWDYTGAFLNIQGRICFVSVFGFGVIGAVAILLIMPRYLARMRSYSLRTQQILSISLTTLFIADSIYSLVTLFLK